MAGRPGFRVLSSWSRPTKEQKSAFECAGSAQVADSMSRLGAMDSGIRAVWNSPRIIGSALTAWCHAGDNLMLHKAISMAHPGDILVVNTQGSMQNSPFGELLATSAKKLGIVGVIIDGTVRDAECLEAMELPVYSRGLGPGGCNKDGGGEVGATIACGGVAVAPGDIIIADRDGVTVVRLQDADEVAVLCSDKVASETKRKAEIEAGVYTRPEIDRQLKELKVID